MALTTMWANFVNSGLSPNKEKSSLIRHARVINTLSLVFLSVVILYSIVAYASNIMSLYLPIAITLSLTLANLVALRYTLNPTLAGHILTAISFLIAMYYMYLMGGFFSTSTNWLIAAPVIAGVLVSVSVVYIYAIIAVAYIAILFLLEFYGVALPDNPISPQFLMLYNLANTILPIITLTAITVAFLYERHLTENKLRRKTHEAYQSNQVKSTFLANISHELRTPMNGVLGMLSLTLDTTLSEQQRDYIKTAHESSKALLTILNDIIDISEIKSHQLDVKLSDFNLKSLLDEMAVLFAASIQQTAISMELNYHSNLSEFVHSDPGRIRQVIAKLVSNAVKFTHHGTVVISAEKSTLHGLDVILIHIKDNGIGISPEKQHSIFELFQQEDLSSTRNYGGTGLGLSLCKHIVELLDGELSVTSKPGDGATFSVQLPLLETKNSEIKITHQEATPTNSSINTQAKILLVEDNIVNQKVSTLALKKIGFSHIDIAKNGQEAVNKIDLESHYDLIFMDCHMPVMDGFSATVEIRKLYDKNSLPIIALTADLVSESIDKCFQSGMNDHMAKPLNIGKLTHMLAKWLPQK